MLRFKKKSDKQAADCRTEPQGARSGIDPGSEMKMLETKRLCDCPQFLRILP